MLGRFSPEIPSEDLGSWCHVNFIIILARLFLLKQNEELFLTHILGKFRTVFGKKCTNLSFKFGVLIIGEIEQFIFCAPPTFCLAKKVW